MEVWSDYATKPIMDLFSFFSVKELECGGGTGDEGIYAMLEGEQVLV